MALDPGLSHLEAFESGCATLDPNLGGSEFYIIGGIMNPKELYLTEEREDEAQVKDAASSSDSGISGAGSALDDLHDIADVTDLNSLIDGELKELDFSFDFSSLGKLPQIEATEVLVKQDDSFSAAVVKQEPVSPTSLGPLAELGLEENSFCVEPVSPELYNLHNEITIKEECGTGVSPYDHHLQQHLQHHLDSFSIQQQDIDYSNQHVEQQHFGLSAAAVAPSPPPSSLSFSPPHHQGYHIISPPHHPVSPTSSSSSSASSPTPCNQLPLGHGTQQQQQQQQRQQKVFTFSPNTSPSAGQHPHGHIIHSLNQHQQHPATNNSNHLSKSTVTNNGQGRKISTFSTLVSAPMQARRTHPASVPVSGKPSPLTPHTPPTLLPVVTLASPAPGSGGVKVGEVLDMTSSGGLTVISPSAANTASPPPSSFTSGQIDAILNSNIRIQPKPGAELQVSTGNLQWVTTAASVVSQPAAIAVTTQQGIPILGSPGAIATTITDEKSLKRAQRIIKNRESACLSRKRRKEYMSSLEERLQQCASENERLLQENTSLRRQVAALQKENTELRQPQTGGSAAKKICLMCVAILVTLNLSSLSLTNLVGESTSSYSSDAIPGLLPPSAPMVHHPAGRSLLGVADPADLSNPDSWAINDSGGGGGGKPNTGAWSRFLAKESMLTFDQELSLLAEKLNHTSCPMYFNSTESLRLAEQLRGWMISQEEEKLKKKKQKSRSAKSAHGLLDLAERQGQQQQQQSQRLAGSDKPSLQDTRTKKAYPTLRRFGNSAATYGGDDPAVTAGQDYPMQVFSPGYDRQERLLDAIPRRNDTFYVFSFSTDYFLVPATAHNKTTRPRMSLLMPVISSSLNESGEGEATDQVGVMQIDCEILNTNLIHVHRSAFQDTADSTARNASSSSSTQQNQQQHSEELHTNNSTTSSKYNNGHAHNFNNIRGSSSGEPRRNDSSSKGNKGRKGK